MKNRIPAEFVGLFLAAAGLVAIGGARYQWRWFMDHPKARFIIRLLGRERTRIFYTALGVVLLALGLALALAPLPGHG